MVGCNEVVSLGVEAAPLGSVMLGRTVLVVVMGGTVVVARLAFLVSAGVLVDTATGLVDWAVELSVAGWGLVPVLFVAVDALGVVGREMVGCSGGTVTTGPSAVGGAVELVLGGAGVVGCPGKSHSEIRTLRDKPLGPPVPLGACTLTGAPRGINIWVGFFSVLTFLL